MLIDFTPNANDFYEGNNTTPLLRYLLFAGRCYYPEGGALDLVATADTIEELKETRYVQEVAEYEWWQIAEHATLRIVEEGEY